MGSHGTLDRVYVIPTEVEGSHGTLAEPVVKMARFKGDLIEVAEPMFSDPGPKGRANKTPLGKAPGMSCRRSLCYNGKNEDTFVNVSLPEPSYGFSP